MFKLNTKGAEEALRNAEQHPSLCTLTVTKDAEVMVAVEEVAAGVYANPCDAGGNDDNACNNGDAFEMVKEDAAAVVIA